MGESGVVVATDMTSGKPIKVIPGWQFGVAFPTGITLTPDKKFFLIADANSNVGFVSTSNLEPRIDMTVPVRIEPGFARRGVHLSSSELI